MKGVLLWMLLVLPGCGGAEREEAAMRNAIMEGLRSLEVYDFDGAYAVLSPVVEQLEGSESNWETGMYAAAVAAWHKTPGSEERIEEAKALLERLLADAADADRRARYALDLGRIEEVEDYPGDEANPEGAEDWYNEARELATEVSLVVESGMRLAQLKLQELSEAGTAEAEAILLELVEAVQEEPWRSTVLMYLGEIQTSYGDKVEDGVATFLRVDPEYYPVRSRTDGFIWRRAVLCEETGRYAEAIEQLELLLANYPRSVYRTVARRKIEELEPKA